MPPALAGLGLNCRVAAWAGVSIVVPVAGTEVSEAAEQAVGAAAQYFSVPLAAVGGVVIV